MPSLQRRQFCAAFFGDTTLITEEWVDENWDYFATAPEVCPTTGANHLQWYGVTKKPVTITGCVKIWNLIGCHSHCVICTGTHEENISYCKGPYSKNGKEKPLNPNFKCWKDDYDPEGGRNKKNKWKDALENAKLGRFSEIDPHVQISQYQNLRRVHADAQDAQDLKEPCGLWIWGLAGTGKSTKARSFGDYWMKECVKWWDLYTGQANVIMDDLDQQNFNALERYLKIWADQYAFQPEVKGGTMGKIRPKMFIVTSQYSLAQMCKSPEVFAAMDRRFDQLEMKLESLQPVVISQQLIPRAAALAAGASTAHAYAPPAVDPAMVLVPATPQIVPETPTPAMELLSLNELIEDGEFLIE